ncbi:MAG: DDE-type integrase/transposase/recombinase [Kiritimatiellae bacterium]|nr:DDE-type integrase/transposase/recombinase [Kiritimatiellia bacterium]MBQ3343712.1 DDE-type integrase/transposase/recombinase [Kiritimatiellia bacterium]
MDKSDKERLAIAHVKLGLISPLLNGTYPDASKAAYRRRVAEVPVEMPNGTTARFKPATLATWEHRYRKSGFDALVDKGRGDCGKSRSIDDDLGEEIEAMRAEHPKMGAQMVIDALVAQGSMCAGEISVRTMQRWFSAHPLPGEGAEAKDRRAFEAAHANDMWQADTLYGPYVARPKKQRAYLQAVIDDKSRKVVAARFVAADSAAEFQRTLRRAVATHGIPSALYVDNGAPYKNGQLALICGNLGCALIHAPVRDGASKGKIERLNRTIRMQCLSCLPEGACDSLDSLNDALSAWVLAYNSRIHSATRKAPSDSFAEDGAWVRYVEDGDALDEAFRNSVRRKVAKDATVRVDGTLYDAPMGCIGERLEVRYTPGDPLDVWMVLGDGSRVRIAPTDKQGNAHAKRKKSHIDYAAQGGE